MDNAATEAPRDARAAPDLRLKELTRAVTQAAYEGAKAGAARILSPRRRHWRITRSKSKASTSVGLPDAPALLPGGRPGCP